MMRLTRVQFLAWVATISACCVFLFIVNGHASAESRENETAIRASPAVIEFAFTPGDTQVKTVRLTNEGNQPVAYRLQIENLQFANATARQRLDPRFNIRNWVTLSDAALVLSPEQTREVSIEITPPDNASPGGHYAQLFAQPLLPENSNSEQAIQALPEISIPILTTVGGDTTTSFELNRAKSTRFSRAGRTLLTSDFLVENTGNVHVLMRPVFVLYRGDKKVQEFEIEPELILPSEQKEVSGLFDPPERLGRYQVELSIFVGEDNKVQQSYSVWAMPNPLILVSVAAGLSIAFYVFRKRHNIEPAIRVLLR